MQRGDRIRYAGSAGIVEFIADAADPTTRWYVKEFGGGCMIRTDALGSVFLPSTGDEEDLELLSRASE